MFYYLYEIRNNLNGKIYVGVHKTEDMNDGYMGSGKVIRNAIAKHGIVNFTKVILETFENAEAMYAREKEVVNDEFLLREDVYNLRRGGTGGFGRYHCNLAEKRNKELREERVARYLENPNKCLHCDYILPYNKRKYKFCCRSCSQSFNNKLREHSIEHRNKIRLAFLGIPKSEEHKKNISIARRKKLAEQKRAQEIGGCNKG